MNCVHCKAPLVVPETGLTMTCRYCGNGMAVPDAEARRSRAEAESRRLANDEKARVKQERREAKEVLAASKKAKKDARSTVARVVSGLVTGVVMLIIPIAATYSLWMPKLKALLWDGKQTFVCETNGKSSFSDVKAEILDGPVFELGINCEVSCENCELRGETIAEMGANAVLTLKGGSVSVEGTAFEFTGSNGKLRLKGVEVSAGTLVDGERPDIDLRDVTLVTTETAIDLSSHGKARLKNTSVRAPLPIRMGSHADVSVRGGELLGVKVAVEVGGHGHIQFHGQTKVVGKFVKRNRNAKVLGEENIVREEVLEAPQAKDTHEPKKSRRSRKKSNKKH